MAISTRVEPIERDIALILNEDLSPKARSKVLAQFAREAIDEASAQNRSVLGRVPPYRVIVDGHHAAALESVQPDGVIVAEWDLIDDTLIYIAELIERLSPERSGQFKRNNVIFADGTAIEIGGNIPQAEEYVFMNLTPYARKVERGLSKQAPDGVYQIAATMAKQRFGNVARISFSYRTAISGSIIGGRAGNTSSERNPAIIVKLR